MTVETATKISQLNAVWPAGTDPKSEGDNHLRLLKSVLQASFDDSGTTLKTTLPIDSPAGAKVNGKPVAAATARRTNLVINGALIASQENGATEGTTNAYYAVDQIYAAFAASSAAIGFGRIAAPNPSGSQHRLRFRVTTAKASLAAGDVASIETRLEGTNVYDLGWANAGSQKDAVLSFGFNGPAGTYSVAIRNWTGSATTHSFVASFTISAGQANTDTLQVIRVPAPAGMTTWAIDTSAAMFVAINLASGATGLAAAGWNSGNFTGVIGMSNGLAAVQSFFVWDLYFGADPDKTVTPPVFEVPDYATELTKCQRYWTKLSGLYLTGYQSAGLGVYESYILPTTMRISPSASVANQANASNATNLIIAGIITPTTVTAVVTITATGGGLITFDMIANARM